MKYTIILVGILLINCLSFAQTDQINQQKYWKFRDDLREDFVKISPLTGGSLIARALKPNYCWNNIPDSPGVNSFSMGEMQFGDGMIRQGYYLGLLATEYKLLKDAGQNTRGVLNELYYALEAINRVDKNAEPEQSAIYQFISPNSLNGFYQREDIPDNFAEANWSTTDMRMECVNSPHFNTNNALKLNQASVTNGQPDLYSAPNSYQNVPSIDQLSSLMMGFRLVHKLVDNEFVKPTSSDDGFYIVTETQAIVNRIMTYLNEHNWMMIDVNGWPVNNGGGDVVWAAYPLASAAFRITGNTYDTDWTRRIEDFYISNPQYCITGFGTSDASSEGQLNACGSMAENTLLYGFNFSDILSTGGNAGLGPGQNNQNHSVFQEWTATGAFHGTYNDFAYFWNFPDLEVVEDGLKGLLREIGTLSILNQVDEEIAPVSDGNNDRNFGILFSNLEAAASLLNADQINELTNNTGNKEIDLINAVLKGQLPVGDRTFFKNYLDAMSMNGPYNFTASLGQVTTKETAGGGWGSEHRWTWSSEIYGGSETGIFNGLDYMLFHNLYRIVFPDNQPVFSPEQAEECYCNPTLSKDPADIHPHPDTLLTLAQKQEMANEINDKLIHIHTCTENVFKKVNNDVTDNFVVAPYFPEYSDIDIFINKFETENATVEPTGYVDVRTPLILCNNSTLNIKTNGVMKINEKHVSVNDGSTIDLSGELYVQGGTQLRVKTGGQLIIRSGGKLILHENCSVIIEPGATLTYYEGAKIYTKEETGTLEIKGNLNLQENAVFNIDHSLSTISGLLLFTGNPVINAKPGAKFYLDSKGKNDPILALSANTLVKFSDPDIVEVRLVNCGVDLSKTNSSIRFEQPVYTNKMRFSGAPANAGKIYVTERNHFIKTEFVDMYLGAELDIENASKLFVDLSSFTQTDPVALIANGISVLGMGYNIQSTTFAINGSGNAMIESSQLTMTSNISSCTFNSTNNSIGRSAIYDVSNAEVIVRSCTFNHLKNAINKALGILVLKCDKFNNSYENSVTVTKTCHLNMSTSAGGGYNTFESMTGTSDRCHILLQDATINMFTGSNYLKDVPVAGGLIKGKLLNPCSTASNCNLDFSGNQWNTLPFLSPPSGRFVIKSANNFVVQVNTITPLPQTGCGSLDGITVALGHLKSLTLGQLGQLPFYFSQLTGQNVSLLSGIQTALSKMTVLHDDSGNDIEAVERFNEIFASTIDYSEANDITKELFEFSQKNMKIALESYYDQSYSTANDFETHVMMYLNALNKLTPDVISADNYKSMFKQEIEKAHVMRIIGQYDKSMDVLVHLENCGLDLAEQEIVNLEKSFIDRDLQIVQIGEQIIDQPTITNPSPKITPVTYAGPYNFGVIIQGFNNFIYPGCHDFKSLMTESVWSGLTVFPNPVQDELNISFQNSFEESSLLEIMQPDGRLVYRGEIIVSSEVPTKVNVSDWESGAYKIRVIHPDGTQQNSTFVIR